MAERGKPAPPGGHGEGEDKPWRRDRYGSRFDQDRTNYGSGFDAENGEYGKGDEEPPDRISRREGER